MSEMETIERQFQFFPNTFKNEFAKLILTLNTDFVSQVERLNHLQAVSDTAFVHIVRDIFGASESNQAQAEKMGWASAENIVLWCFELSLPADSKKVTLIHRLESILMFGNWDFMKNAILGYHAQGTHSSNFSLELQRKMLAQMPGYDDLPRVTKKALAVEGIQTLGDLLGLSEESLKKIPNTGKRTFSAVKEFLVWHNLSLRTLDSAPLPIAIKAYKIAKERGLLT